MAIAAETQKQPQPVRKRGRPLKKRRIVHLPIEDTSEEPEDITEKIEGASEVGGVLAWRKGPDLVILYDPRGDPFPIQASPHNFQQLLSDGWTINCPHCGGQHEDWDNPNACPRLPKVKGALCEICGKIIYDDRNLPQKAALPGADNPNLIKVDAVIPTSAEDRVIAKLREHYRAFHPTHARNLALQGR